MLSLSKHNHIKMRQLTKKEIKKAVKELEIVRSQEISLILDNVQYARNVASCFRLADAAAVKNLYLGGISPLPPFGKELQQVSRQKEKSVRWEAVKDVVKLIKKLKADGYWVVAIEYTDQAFPIEKLPVMAQGKNKICYVAGSEVYGVTNKVLDVCDAAVYIPMYGRGASINVTHAVAVALFRL
jgi:23S rRNA (guanosine2251-2'-O)-methyltransferase